jgi:hypothetical protein
MTLIALGRTHDEAERRLDRAVERFRGPRERCHSATLEEAAELLGRYHAAGVRRIYLQHPDREDFGALELIGELAERVAWPAVDDVA